MRLRPYGLRRDKCGFVFFALEKRQKNGGRTQNRTGDTGIFSPLLYRLSYPATRCAFRFQHFLIYHRFFVIQAVFYFFLKNIAFLYDLTIVKLNAPP